MTSMYPSSSFNKSQLMAILIPPYLPSLLDYFKANSRYYLTHKMFDYLKGEESHKNSIHYHIQKLMR